LGQAPKSEPSTRANTQMSSHKAFPQKLVS
jgi:hypothetical protein